jgi:hypothetical protein
MTGTAPIKLNYEQEISKEECPAIYHGLSLMRKVFGNRMPHIMTAYKACIERIPGHKPKPALWAGFMPMIKMGDARPIFRIVKPDEVKFYDFDWNEIDEKKYVEMLSEMATSNIKFDDPNVTYNKEKDTFTIKGPKG